VLNKEKMAAAFTGVQTVFDNVLKAFTPDWKNWATTLPSTTETEDYHWVDLLVTVKEFFGEKIIGALRAQKWSVKNREWYAAWAEKTRNINNDKLGLLGSKTQDAMTAALNHPQFLLEDAVGAGFATACFDSQYFYDTDHPTLDGVAGTTVSNLRTLPFTYDNVRKIWNDHLVRCKNAQGQRLILEPDSCFVGNKNKSLAEDFFNFDKKPLSLNDGNALKGKFAVRYCPKFDESGYEEYFVLTFKIMGSSLKFAAYQERLLPVLTCTAMQSTNEFGAEGVDAIQWEHKEVRWSVDFEGAATLTLWVLAVGSTGSDAAE
jgi:hypothetical protein